MLCLLTLGLLRCALMPLRDMSSGMHHVTATPASITSSTRLLSRASPPAWPGGETTPSGGSIPRWLADSNSVNIARVPYCHALYQGSLTHARGLSTACGGPGAGCAGRRQTPGIAHRGTAGSEVPRVGDMLYRPMGCPHWIMPAVQHRAITKQAHKTNTSKRACGFNVSVISNGCVLIVVQLTVMVQRVKRFPRLVSFYLAYASNQQTTVVGLASL